MLKRFRADRAFDDFAAGQEVELDPEDGTHARWIATGYLEPLEDADPDEEAPTSTTVPEAPADPGEPAAAKKGRRRTAATDEPTGTDPATA